MSTTEARQLHSKIIWFRNGKADPFESLKISHLKDSESVGVLEQTSHAGRSARNSPLLLDLRNAIQQAERCRLALKLVLRPQILDAIITLPAKH